VCPACGHKYETWYRSSINLSLGEEWTEDEIRAATHARCSHCGFESAVETLIVETER
jgi:DNA-directed RNA polymerase subunit RPC12/RpoP